MAETCPKCGRPTHPDDGGTMYDWCDGGADECDAYAAAYRRGIDTGVELAKRRVDATAAPIRSGYRIDFYWHEVDAAAAAAKGEA